MKVYTKSVAAGDVTLGGNLQTPAAGAGSNYFVIVKPAVAAAVAAPYPGLVPARVKGRGRSCYNRRL